MGGLVEAVHFLDAFHQLRGQTLGILVVAPRHGVGAAAGKTAAGTAGANPLEFGQCLFNRAARSGLDNDKVQQQNAEQGRQHQQQAFADIEFHFAVLSHQVSSEVSSGTYLPNSGCRSRDW